MNQFTSRKADCMGNTLYSSLLKGTPRTTFRQIYYRLDVCAPVKYLWPCYEPLIRFFIARYNVGQCMVMLLAISCCFKLAISYRMNL